MTTQHEKWLEIWYDQTSDFENPRWCVSVCTEDGEDSVLAVVDSQHKACMIAGRESEIRDLPVLRNESA